MIASIVLALIFFTLGALHVFWVLGGQWGLNATVPDIMKTNPFIISSTLSFKITTMVVALILFSFMTLALINGELITMHLPQPLLKYSTLFVCFVFAIRAIGDFKHVGFFKKQNGSLFAKRDSQFFSPLCLFISLLMLYQTIQHF